MQTHDTNVLDRLIEAFKKKSPMVRIGILGDGKAREGGGSNADIGAKHEFGADGMPQRSFLRMPLNTHLDKFLSNAGAFDRSALKRILTQKKLDIWMNKIGIAAHDVIMEAFHTGGWGKWPPWRNPRYKNLTGDLLVNTQQLRNSITWKIIK